MGLLHFTEKKMLKNTKFEQYSRNTGPFTIHRKVYFPEKDAGSE